MKSLSLSLKLIGGFVIVALITLGVGLTGWYGASSLSAHLNVVCEDLVPGFTSILTMSRDFESIRVAQRTLLDPGLGEESRQRQYDNASRAMESSKRASARYESLEHSPEEVALWKQFTPVMAAWMKESDEFFQLGRELEKNGVLDPTALRADLEKFTGDHYKCMSNTVDLIHLQKRLEGGDDPTQCAFGKWMAAFKTDNAAIDELLKAMALSHETFHLSVKKIKELVESGNRESASLVYNLEMMPAAETVFENFAALREKAAVAEGLLEKLNEKAMVRVYEKQKEAIAILNKIIGMNEAEVAELRKEAAADMGRTRLIALSGMSVGSVAALALGIISALSITRPITRVIEGISEGAEQVAAASGQVASASLQLAEGASQQAAAIEETSASVEELSSMTGQNADNASEANALMAETSRVVEAASASMNDLSASMLDVSRASEETFKIIKTIDQIAFQTNLLALNAAVEAARAGEAGAGFSVVADEVRNLAMRAAEAATNTAGLIEGTVKKINNGSILMSQANEAFARVSESSKKVAGLVGEINAASREQAQGINQISKAIAEMDKVTQQNASSAEESASASEQMRTQAEQMKEFVSGLVDLVSGTGRHESLKSRQAAMRNDVEVMPSPWPTSPPRHGVAIGGVGGGVNGDVHGNGNGNGSKGKGYGMGGGNSPVIKDQRQSGKDPRHHRLIALEEGFEEF